MENHCYVGFAELGVVVHNNNNNNKNLYSFDPVMEITQL